MCFTGRAYQLVCGYRTADAIDTKALAARFAATKVLVVDDEHYMRKVVRTLLMSIGVRTIYEAPDGPAGLELIRTTAPDVVIVDWEMPGLDGADFRAHGALARRPSRSRTCRSSCSPATASARA